MLKVSLAIACAVSCRGWRRPDRTPKTTPTTICAGIRAARAFCDHAAEVWLRYGGGRAPPGRRSPSVRSRSLWCRVFLTISARVGASVPRPHAASAEYGRAGPRGQGRCRSGSAAQCPDGGLGHHRDGSGHPFEGPGGPGPVQGQKNQIQLHPGLAVIASHPGIVAPAAGVRQAPGLPPPRPDRTPLQYHHN